MSSDFTVIFDRASDVFLFGPPQRLPLTIVADAPTPEDAVNSLRKTIPPSTARYVFVLIYDFQKFQRSVEALQKAGYTNIESIDIVSLSLSSNIWNLPLNCAVGEHVFVITGLEEPLPLDACKIMVIRKCEAGWQAVKPVDIPLALIEYPWVCDIVYFKDAPEADKAKIKQLFSGRKLHPSVMVHPGFKETFVRSRISKSGLDGFEVLPFCRYNILIRFGDKLQFIVLKDQVPPLTITKEFDVGDVPIVEIRGEEYTVDSISTHLIKTFKFKTSAFRTVSITIYVDKTLLPQVTLKTVTMRDTVPLQTPVIYGVADLPSSGFTFVAYKRDGSFEECFLSSVSEVIESMKKKTSYSPTLIVFTYTDTVTIDKLRCFRDECLEAGYRNLRFISSHLVNFSMVIKMAGISIEPGQLVAVLHPDIFFIVEKKGERLKIRKSCKKSVVEVNKSKVDTVVISNLNCDFPMPFLDTLRSVLPARKHHIVTGMDKLGEFHPKYMWSLADGTNFDGYRFDDVCDFDFVIHGINFYKYVPTLFKEVPFTITVDADVDNVGVLTVDLFRREKTAEVLDSYYVSDGTKSVRFTISVESACDVTVVMDVVDMDGYDGSKEETQDTVEDGESAQMVHLSSLNDEPVDPLESAASEDDRFCTSCGRCCECTQYLLKEMSVSPDDDIDHVGSLPTLSKELSQPELNPPPATILTFTSDNRVLIEADETYTGDYEVLAYVRLRNGKAPQVGKRAFNALKGDPNSVFYDITRLLSFDFDPNHPHPMWSFKTTRGADGKVVIHGGDNIKTTPIVLFGLVVNSTLLYIQEHSESDVTTLGIQLPTDCLVSNDDLENVSDRIGVELVIW
uniref:Piwi domain-containing protein n=1 Tax=Panagrellus redivivus TaxID=6233 RepID=A0A7E4V6A6_PANRE